jgi:hypothetical protein
VWARGAAASRLVMLVRTREYRHRTEVPHHRCRMIESSIIDLDQVSRLSCLNYHDLSTFVESLQMIQGLDLEQCELGHESPG